MPTPDVRVRLSAEGIAEVVQALKLIRDEAEKTADKSKKKFIDFNKVLSNMKGQLAALGAYLSFRAFAGFVRGGGEAADQMGKLALRIGTTTEKASTLAYIARKSDADLNAMAAAGAILAQRVEDLRDGLPEVEKQFGKLGLRAKDFEGLDTADAFALIAERLSKMETGARKTGIAIKIMGEQGGRIIPAMNELGKVGLPAAVEAAEELGLVLDQETADSIIALNDDMETLKAQTEFLAAAFLSGLAPAVRTALGLVSGEVGGLKDDFEDVGTGLGRVLTFIGLIFGTIFDLLATLFENLGKLIGSLAIVGGAAHGIARAILKRDFAEIPKIYKAAQKTIDDAALESANNLDKRLEALVNRWNAVLYGPKPTPPASQEPEDEEIDPTEIAQQAQFRAEMTRIRLQSEIAQIRAQLKLRADEEKRAYELGLRGLSDYYAQRRQIIEEQSAATVANLEEQLRLAGEISEPRARGTAEAGIQAQLDQERLALAQAILSLTIEEEAATRRLGQQRLRFEQTILEAQGRTHEAKIQQIDEQVRQYDLLLRQQGLGDEERVARINELRRLLDARAGFDEIVRQGQLAMQQLAVDRQRIEADVAAGALTQIQGQTEILELEQARLPLLREIADQMLVAAEATKDPALIAQAQEFANALREMGDASSLAAEKMAQFRDNVEQALTSDLSNWLSDGVSDAKNFKEAMQSLAYSVVKSLQRIAAEIIATAAIAKLSSLFGGGGQVAAGKAGGGLIRGPGTGTSDSIPAWLSDNEFVVRSAVVRRPGMLGFLNAINRGLVKPPPPTAPAFAEGGLVSGGGRDSEGRLLVGLEEGLILRALESPEGQKIFVRNASKNRRSLRRLVG